MKPSFYPKEVTCLRRAVSTRNVKEKEVGKKRKEKEKPRS